MRWQGRLWRQMIAAEAGDALEALSAALGAPVRPTWTGWEIRAGARRVRFRGGLRGFRTRVWSAGALVLDRHGLLPATEVTRILGERGSG